MKILSKLAPLLLALTSACGSVHTGVSALPIVAGAKQSGQDASRPALVKTDTLDVVVTPAVASKLSIGFLANRGPLYLYPTGAVLTFMLSPTTKGCASNAGSIVCKFKLPIPSQTSVLEVMGAGTPRLVVLPPGNLVAIGVEGSQAVAKHVASGLGPTSSGTWTTTTAGAVTFSGTGYVIFNDQDALGYTIVGGAASSYTASLQNTTTGWVIPPQVIVVGPGLHPDNFAILTPPASGGEPTSNALLVTPTYGPGGCTTCGFAVPLASNAI